MTPSRCAVLVLPLLFSQGITNAAPPESAAASGAQPAIRDRPAASLEQQRLRKCKAMTGDEKAACERDARTVADQKAQHDSRNGHAGSGR